MISDYLDRDYVLSQTRAQRDWLADLLAQAQRKDPRAVAAMKQHGVTVKQLRMAIAALDAAQEADQLRKRASDSAFIPSDPILCNFQAGSTEMADRRANTANVPEPSPQPVRRRRGSVPRGSALPIDTSATQQLKRRSPAGKRRGKSGQVTKAPFVEGDDLHYGLDGFKAKFGALFTGRHSFNPQPAQPAISTRPLRLFVFGDWGTGLPLAQQVTARIREQLDAADGSRQQHVVHLGDVYYVGTAAEYTDRVLAAGCWPVNGSERNQIGSWSLNGNHDMYSGGFGYFDKLLRDGRFLRWHRDTSGQPSSFFLIEDANWQFFGLDTSWNLPSLSGALLGKPTMKDYGGQNGLLTAEQVTWMAQQRRPTKGCVLMTHHQPASSRTTEDQHSDEAVRQMKQAGVYNTIDAWLWGHEHRCVVFKPKAERHTPRLRQAPDFCACIGHGGVPVTEKNFARQHRIADVAWEEDRLDASSPIYEGEHILSFGFARIDTLPNSLDFRLFDHRGDERFQVLFTRR